MSPPASNSIAAPLAGWSARPARTPGGMGPSRVIVTGLGHSHGCAFLRDLLDRLPANRLSDVAVLSGCGRRPGRRGADGRGRRGIGGRWGAVGRGRGRAARTHRPPGPASPDGWGRATGGTAGADAG